MTTAVPSPDDRITVRIRFENEVPVAYLPRGRNARLPFGRITHYVERPGKTPTGGRYTSRKFTLRAPGGRVWYGTMKKDSDIVRCRPAPQPVTASPSPAFV